MPIDLTPISRGTKKRIPLEEIDQDVIEAVEAGFEYCKDHTERLQAKFADKDTAEEFLRAARSYAYHHDPRLVVTGNPTAKGEARFRVELYAAPETKSEAA